MIGSSITETNFLHKLLLIDRLIETLSNIFANLSANKKLSKKHEFLHKYNQVNFLVDLLDH